MDSQALFFSMVKAAGLQDFSEKFTEQGMDTISTFVFAGNYTPGAENDVRFLEQAILPILGNEGHIKVKSLHKLHFDCFHQVAAEALRRTTQDDDSKPKKLPAPERQVRLEAIKERLKPIRIKGELLPSNLLIDKYVSMAESGEVKHVKWAELTKHDQEI